MEKRLMELEIKLGLAEHLIDELGKTTFRQQEQIDLLQAQLRHIYSLLQNSLESASGEVRSLRDEIPPHY